MTARVQSQRQKINLFDRFQSPADKAANFKRPGRLTSDKSANSRAPRRILQDGMVESDTPVSEMPTALAPADIPHDDPQPVEEPVRTQAAAVSEPAQTETPPHPEIEPAPSVDADRLQQHYAELFGLKVDPARWKPANAELMPEPGTEPAATISGDAATPEQINHGAVLRETTKLQIMDFLSGRKCRGAENYSIHFDTHGQVSLVLPRDHPGDYGDFGFPLPPVVDKAMCGQILGLKAEQLPEGDREAKRRLATLQAHVRDLIRDGAVIDVDQWDQETHVHTAENSYFRRDYDAAEHRQAMLSAQRTHEVIDAMGLGFHVEVGPLAEPWYLPETLPDDVLSSNAFLAELTKMQVIDFLTGRVERSRMEYVAFTHPADGPLSIAVVENEWAHRSEAGKKTPLPPVIDTRLEGLIRNLDNHRNPDPAFRRRLDELKGHIEVLKQQGRIIQPHAWQDEGIRHLEWDNSLAIRPLLLKQHAQAGQKSP